MNTQNKKISIPSLYIIVSILTSSLIYIYWLKYSDSTKSLGEISKYLTSQNLTGWNFGEIDQRLSVSFWGELILKKNLIQNPLSILGLIAALAIFRAKTVNVRLIVSLFILWFAPMFIFANLHVVHVYYQTENLIFLIILVSISIGGHRSISSKGNICQFLSCRA